MDSLSLLQGIFPTQGLYPGLPHCRQILYQLSHQGSPRILEWVAYPFSSRSSWPRNQTGVSCIAGGFFTNWAIREAQYSQEPCESGCSISLYVKERATEPLRGGGGPLGHHSSKAEKPARGWECRPACGGFEQPLGVVKAPQPPPPPHTVPCLPNSQTPQHSSGRE